MSGRSWRGCLSTLTRRLLTLPATLGPHPPADHPADRRIGPPTGRAGRSGRWCKFGPMAAERSSVRTAVIPAAGLGTRLLPATKSQPKEMVPVVDKPAIQYAVEEAAAAGIDDVLI